MSKRLNDEMDKVHDSKQKVFFINSETGKREEKKRKDEREDRRPNDEVKNSIRDTEDVSKCGREQNYSIGSTESRLRELEQQEHKQQSPSLFRHLSPTNKPLPSSTRLSPNITSLQPKLTSISSNATSSSQSSHAIKDRRSSGFFSELGSKKKAMKCASYNTSPPDASPLNSHSDSQVSNHFSLNN